MKIREINDLIKKSKRECGKVGIRDPVETLCHLVPQGNFLNLGRWGKYKYSKSSSHIAQVTKEYLKFITQDLAVQLCHLVMWN